MREGAQSFLVPLLIRTLILSNQHPTFKTSFNLNYFLRDPISIYHILGFRVSKYRFLGTQIYISSHSIPGSPKFIFFSHTEYIHFIPTAPNSELLSASSLKSKDSSKCHLNYIWVRLGVLFTLMQNSSLATNL